MHHGEHRRNLVAAIKDVFEDTRTVLEPAGALGVAGLKRFARERRLPEGAAVAIASGANINFDRLAFVAERTALGEHHEAMLAVTIPEEPGAFLDFSAAIGQRNITEFNYRLASREEAHIFVGIETRDDNEAAAIARDLERRGYRCHDLTDNELAKSHIRHMVGGRCARGLYDERAVRFRTSRTVLCALMKFLSALGGRWNISLFHYRNNGGAYGRVLCGFEAPAGEREDLMRRAAGVGVFLSQKETANPCGPILPCDDLPLPWLRRMPPAAVLREVAAATRFVPLRSGHGSAGAAGRGMPLLSFPLRTCLRWRGAVLQYWDRVSPPRARG